MWCDMGISTPFVTGITFPSWGSDNQGMLCICIHIHQGSRTLLTTCNLKHFGRERKSKKDEMLQSSSEEAGVWVMRMFKPNNQRSRGLRGRGEKWRENSFTSRFWFGPHEFLNFLHKCFLLPVQWFLFYIFLGESLSKHTFL